jgi:hypothetical protein
MSLPLTRVLNVMSVLWKFSSVSHHSYKLPAESRGQAESVN